MKNLIDKIKNLTLEQINKNLIFVALFFLLFRIGSFTLKSTSNPFELILILISLLFLIDIIKNNKIKEFFFSINKNVRIALIFFVSSILCGWTISLLKGIPTTLNMFLEFGNLIFSIDIFLLIIFYTRNDKKYIKWYLYSLLIPLIYIICIVFPSIANYFSLTNGLNFLGFTTNENIISKILIIPSLFFISNSLIETKNIWLKIFYIIISSSLFSLLLWVSSRAAIASLLLGCIFIYILILLNNLSWKVFFSNGLLIILIIFIGFFITPYGIKKLFINRILNFDGVQPNYILIKDKPIGTIIKDSFFVKKIKSKNDVIFKNDKPLESRFIFWPIYIKNIVLNPFGFGPNTHIEFDYSYRGGKLSLGPHNTYIEAWLWGGVLCLISFIYLIYLAFSNLRIRLKNNFDLYNLSLIGILFTFAILIVANDSLPLTFVWVILSLSLIKNEY